MPRKTLEDYAAIFENDKDWIEIATSIERARCWQGLHFAFGCQQADLTILSNGVWRLMVPAYYEDGYFEGAKPKNPVRIVYGQGMRRLKKAVREIVEVFEGDDAPVANSPDAEEKFRRALLR